MTFLFCLNTVPRDQYRKYLTCPFISNIKKNSRIQRSLGQRRRERQESDLAEGL